MVISLACVYDWYKFQPVILRHLMELKTEAFVQTLKKKEKYHIESDFFPLLETEYSVFIRKRKIRKTKWKKKGRNVFKRRRSFI